MLLYELKKVIFSISFLILIAAIITISVSQDILDFSNEKIEMPQPDQNYGMQSKEIPEIIMPEALNSLYNDFCINSYIAYPIGFYKNVKLNDKKQKRMAEILSALTGVPDNELTKSIVGITQNNTNFIFDDSVKITSKNNESSSITRTDEHTNKKTISDITLKQTISYETFKNYMTKADKLIGGGSNYSETNLVQFCPIPITYEEAIAQYNLSKNSDHFTGAYARLFCDYLGASVLSVLPVFLAVSLCLKDKHSKVNEIIYTRKLSSSRIILIRYFAIIMAVMIPTIILAYISNYSTWKLFTGMTIDYLAPLKYSIGWLLPSIMISTSVGVFFTELTDSTIAIVIQGLWWFLDLNTGINEINNYSLLRLAPRHNSLNNTQIFLNRFNDLIKNRLLFVIISFVLILATIIIYSKKRIGRLNVYDKLKKFITDMANLKNKYEA